MNRLVLWVAQGFGVGRLPFAPGTWGTLVGTGWVLTLVASGSFTAFALGTLAGLVLSVRWCGAAEILLREQDPPSVVLDEIAALPLAFLGWLAWRQMHGGFPSVAALVDAHGLGLTLLAFGFFRVLDIAKPWPIRASQALPGGWGVTVDDVLAALGVNLLWVAAAWAGWL